MRTSIKGLIALAFLSAAAPAVAQDITDPPGDLTVSGSVTLTSDYRFRGISQTDEDATIQGGITLGHTSGLYAGTWGSGIDFAGGTELNVFAGYGREVAPGTAIDVGLLYYVYPGAAGSSDFFEPYASISTTLGPASAKLGVAYAWGQRATGDADNLYLFTDFAAGIPATPVTLTAHVGYSDGAFGGPGGSYWDWSVGADVAVTGPLSVGVKYVDSDLPSVRGQDSAVLFTLSAGF